MKRIIQLLVSCEIILIFVLGANISNIYLQNKLLYDKTAAITIFSPNINEELADLPPLKKTAIFKEVAQATHLNLTKIVWHSQTELSLYTTMPEKFTQGSQLPTQEPTEIFLSNQPSSSTNQIGQLDWLDNRQNLRLYSLTGLNHVGLDGLYFIENDTLENYPDFKKNIQEKLGLDIVEEDNYQGELQFLKALFQEPLLLATTSLLVLMTVFILLFVFISQSKKLALARLLGYSPLQQLKMMTELFKLPCLWGSALGLLLTLYFQGLIVKSFLSFPTALAFSTFGLLLLLIFISLISLLWLTVIVLSKNLYLYIKESKPLLPLMVITKLFILVFLAVLPVLSNQVQEKIQQGLTVQKADKEWLNAQNVYQTSLQYIGHEASVTRPYEKRMHTFYLNNSDTFALIDTSNYDTLASGQPLYAANTHSQAEQLVSPNGQSIQINLTYLKWQPIVKSDGTLVAANDLHYQADSINLLVPTTLKADAEKITQNYQSFFTFKTYRLATNIYEEKIEKLTPKVNLIWVKPKQTYFTYKEDILTSQRNLVTDPIAVVDIGNFDSQIYYSAFTQHIFFKAEPTLSGYEQVAPLIEEGAVQDQIQLVTSIYDFRSRSIHENQKEVAYYLILFVISLSTLLICLSLFTFSLFEKNQKGILLKHYYGYSPFQLLRQYFISWIALDLLVGILTSLVFNQQHLFLLTSLVLLAEIFPFIQIKKSIGETR